MIVRALQELEDDAVLIYLTQDAYQLAQEFADQQANHQKATQVYRNTLAVCAVNNYLRLLGITTDLSQCDSWNPMMRSLINTADLDVVGWGKLECRPISTAEREASPPISWLPSEVQTNRVGYVFIHLDDETGTLLGFTPILEETLDPSNEVLKLSTLQPLSLLLECFEQHTIKTEQAINLSPIEIKTDLPPALTILSNWCEATVASGWQTLDGLLRLSESRFAYRQPSEGTPSAQILSRGKVLSNFSVAGTSVALVVTMTRLIETDVEISLKLYSLSDQSSLPSDLHAYLVNIDGTRLMEANNANGHSLIELRFQAEVGDRFDLIITCWEEEITERFQV